MIYLNTANSINNMNISISTGTEKEVEKFEIETWKAEWIQKKW